MWPLEFMARIMHFNGVIGQKCVHPCTDTQDWKIVSGGGGGGVDLHLSFFPYVFILDKGWVAS